MHQITINREINISGIGLHSGKVVNIRLLPAEANSGIVFQRTDVGTSKEALIPARYDFVKDTRLSTVLTNDYGISIGTIEHLMSALASFLIDNIIIEVDAEEIPILDGSALEYIKAIENVGLKTLYAPKRVLTILKPIAIESEKWKVAFVPSSEFELDVTIDFGDKVIGKQNAKFSFASGQYEKEIASARTFCFLKDIEYMKSVGLARGGSLANAVVVNEQKVLNQEGLRYSNEFAKHKLLDAIGDLYLAGYYIKGKFIGDKCGHASNNNLLRALFSDKTAYKIEDYIPSNLHMVIHSKSVLHK